MPTSFLLGFLCLPYTKVKELISKHLPSKSTEPAQSLGQIQNKNNGLRLKQESSNSDTGKVRSWGVPQVNTSEGALRQWGLEFRGVYKKLRVRSSCLPIRDLFSQRVDGKSNH